MLVEKTITSLEMTSPDQLLAGRVPPVDVVLDSVDATALALIRSTHDRVAGPHHWASLGWSDSQWVQVLSRSGVRCWIAHVGRDVAGMVLMEKHVRHDVEITKFGLIPEFVGLGLGGHLLTQATRLAWDLGGVDRVWLSTTSLDHPHALNNYRNRGFRSFRVERTPWQVQ